MNGWMSHWKKKKGNGRKTRNNFLVCTCFCLFFLISSSSFLFTNANGALVLDSAARAALGGLLSDALAVLAAVQDRPRDLTRKKKKKKKKESETQKKNTGMTALPTLRGFFFWKYSDSALPFRKNSSLPRTREKKKTTRRKRNERQKNRRWE